MVGWTKASSCFDMMLEFRGKKGRRTEWHMHTLSPPFARSLMASRMNVDGVADWPTWDRRVAADGLGIRLIP